MSFISPQGEQSTSSEIALLEALNNLDVSASGEYIRKTGVASFENSIPAGSGSAIWEVDGTETQLISADEIDMQSKKIINLLDPSANQDAATKKYVDDTVIPDTDAKVGIDSVATPGYLGAAYDGGVFRTDTTLDYTDGGDYITIGLDSTLKSNYDAAYTHIGESGASHTYIDQSVISGATPTFTGTNFTAISADDVNITDAGVIITATEVEAALQENRVLINTHTTSLLGKENYHGVESSGTLTFVDGTHILTMASGTNTYWYQGVKFTTADAITIDISAGIAANTLYFITFDDATGALVSSTTPFNWFTQVPVATIFWNGTTGSIMQETHGHTRDLDWHEWAHDTIGTRYGSGLTKTAPTTADDATLTIETGTVYDEDLEITTGQQTTMRGWYQASDGVYTFSDYAFPYLGASADPYWLDTDDYTLKSVADSDFVCYWVYATTDIDRPIYMVPTQAATAHNTIKLARAETAPALGGLNLTPETKLIYRFIYKGDGQFRESDDFRLTSPLPSGGSASTTAGAVSFSPTGDIVATTVQTAIEELDDEKAAIAQTMYIGTTGVAINRTTAALTLAGLTLTTPDIGTPSAGVLTNASGTASSLTAGAVTNATLTTALTVNTGTLTLTADAGNDSVLTIGGGASSVSGANTGDEVVAIGSELDTGTDDVKYASAKAIKDSHNVPSVVPGTDGYVLTSNGTDWISEASSGGGGTTTVDVTQNGHGLAVGNVIKSNGTDEEYEKAQADSSANAEVIGIVVTVDDVNNFTYSLPGIIDTAAAVPNQVAGTVLFLDPDNAGALITADTSTDGEVSKPIAIITQDNVEMMFYNFRGMEVSSTSGATAALDNLAGVAINTTLVSDTYNTDALGTSAIGWSDLFLGTGAVIEWSSAASTSDMTLTHSAEVLTFAGGTVALGTATATGGLTGNITGDVTGSSGSCTGESATVDNATFTTALTVNTGTLTLTAHADNDSVLTIGKGAVSVSGTNTGDQDSADNETPSGDLDGTDVTYTLAHTPNPAASLMLFVNGQFQTAGGEDYTLATATITFEAAPELGDIIRAFYRY